MATRLSSAGNRRLQLANNKRRRKQYDNEGSCFRTLKRVKFIQIGYCIWRLDYAQTVLMSFWIGGIYKLEGTVKEKILSVSIST